MVIVSSLIYLPLTPPSTEFIQTVISYHSDRLETVRTCCNVHHLVVIPLVTMMQMPRCGPHSLNVLLLNVRAITSKTFLMNDLITELKVDCMFLTETWLSSDCSAALIESSIPDYSFSYSIRKGKGWGDSLYFY